MMLRRNLKALALMMALLLSGCSLVNNAVQSQVGDLLTRDLVFLDADKLGRSIAVSQRVNVNIRTRQFSIIQQSEIDANSIRMAGLSHFGSPFFTVKYENGDIETTKMQQLPEAFRPEMVLRDFQLAFWPIDTMQFYYRKKGYEIHENGNHRYLEKDGETIITVVFENVAFNNKDRLLGKTLLTHHLFEYQVEFETMDVSSLESVTKTEYEANW